MTTGERIRQLRIEHQLTQEELGAKVGVQKAAIYKYEKEEGIAPFLFFVFIDGLNLNIIICNHF